MLIPRLSQDGILYLEVWLVLIAAILSVRCFVMEYLFYTPSREEVRRQERAAPSVSAGPLDTFRVYGSFALAVFTAAYAYAYSGDPSAGVPGLRAGGSFAVWTVASVLPLVLFAALCQLEAKTRKPESLRLRVYWLVHIVAWGVVLLVRTDPMASSEEGKTDLADADDGTATALFCVLYGGLVVVGSSYGLFAAVARFDQAEVAATRAIAMSADPAFEGQVVAGPPTAAASATSRGYAKVALDDNGAAQQGSAAQLATGEATLGAALLAGEADAEAAFAPSEGRDRNPECFAGPLSLMYFNWMTNLVLLGWKRRDLGLKVEHLSRMHESDDPTHVNDLFRREWGRQLREFPEKPSLFSALFRAYGREYLIGAVYKFIYDAQQFVGPLLLQLLIQFIDDRTNPDKNTSLRVGYELVGMLALNAITQSIILHQYFHRAFRTGMRLKSATISAIYDKSLRIKPGAAPARDKKKAAAAAAGEGGGAGGGEGEKDEGALKKKTSGEVVNLMTVDAQRLQDTMSYIAMLWSGIFQITLSLVYLFSLLGWAMLAGVAVMAIQIPITAKVTMISRKLQKNVMKVKDERVKVENEVLGGMKIIKLYAWERPYLDKINDIRERELGHLLKYKMLQVFLRVLWSIVPTMVSVSSFATYTGMGQDLTAATAFTALALFNILRFPLAVLPMSISNANEAGLSLERIREFLVSPEVRPLPPLQGQGAFDPYGGGGSGGFSSSPRGGSNPLLAKGEGGGGGGGGNYAAPSTTTTTTTTTTLARANSAGGVRLELNDTELAWDNGTRLLTHVTFSVSDEELCVVVGATGSGKSGLLSAIIGELEPQSGLLATRGSIAYVSQVAWIQNASLRANVLFGQPDPAPGSAEERRYYEILDACALLDDLKQLPDGEATEIGEKGINLSGGQKQRVAIARAVYADADVYLLDDCLSAVDSQVAHHIFERCITSVLAPKAVLFVTHNLQLVTQADKVVLLDGHDRAPFVGSFAEFAAQDSPLARQAAENAQTKGMGSRENSESSLASKGFKSSRSRESLQQLAVENGERASERVASFLEERAKKEAAELQKSKEADGSGGGGGDDDKGKLIESESMEKGAVTKATYVAYIKACGASMFLGGVFGGLIVYNIVVVASSWWLGYWADNGDGDSEDADDGDDILGLDIGTVDATEGLVVYVVISFVGVFVIFLALLAAALSGQRACRVFHQTMLDGIMRAKMSFFDTTPIGRILNRFSNDVANIDEVLPVTMYQWLSTMVAVLIAIATVSLFLPWFLLACVPMGITYYIIMQIYIPTSRELKRLDSILRSPIFSHFGETLEGASIIRAFRAERQFVDASMAKLEKNLRSYYANVSSNRWLAVRLEGIGTGFVVMAALLAVLRSGNGLSAGEGGLALTYALNITQVLNWFVRMSSDREAQIVAVERVVQYGAVEGEAPAVVAECEPARDWPQEGRISFENTAMRYRPGLPLVLKGLTREILPREKVGVVGRTGAGKSSLLLVLLRLVEPEREVNGRRAKLMVDGVNVLEMGLDHLRSRVSIIPQDPVLFTGDVRFNLDPFGNHDDAAVWHALDRSHLGQHIRSLEKGIASEVEEGGRNFSVGQRQQLCLARALLRSSRILLLDEATSAVDHHTDRLVQETIKEEFKECTVLTIAHRLDTIIDYDRILVLVDGEVHEDDSPANLRDESRYPEGVFASMWAAHEAGEL